MTILHGDCLDILPTLHEASIQLIYLDPPFFTQKEHALRTRDNATEYRFTDCWASLDEYLAFMKNVLYQCKRVLKDTGSIFLHCDKSASHHLRVILDEVFGSIHFQSEIIWAYKRWSNAKKGLLNAHQTIYFYSKSADFTFHTIYVDYSPTTNIDQILQARMRNGDGKAVYQRDENGDVVLAKEKKGVPLSDVWQIPFLNPKAKERVGYPTQKPILLLERIIEIATDAGDVVLDPFCGSGTTLVAAHLLGRAYVGIDCSTEAVALTEHRLGTPMKTTSHLLATGESSYLEKTAHERIILKAMGAIPVERNSGIDGFLWSYRGGHPVSVRIQKQGEDIETAKQKLMKASQSKQCSFMIVVRTQRTDQTSIYQQTEPNLMIIDTYDILIEDWIERHNKCPHTKEPMSAYSPSHTTAPT